MKVEEIYSKLSSHMIRGIMVHEQVMNYYNFLGLCGYKKCHEYHYLHETLMHNRLCNYFVNHHNMLIPDEKIENPNAIPESWFKYTRQDVDGATKKNAVKNGLTMWVDWERETKDLYEQMYQELMNIGEIASALFIKCYVCDVDKELKKAEKYQLMKEAVNYDIGHIISEQKHKHEKYKRKIMKCLEHYYKRDE